MPNKTVNYLISKIEAIDEAFNKHLKESIDIQVQLKVNTILTSLILASLVGKFVLDWFKK